MAEIYYFGMESARFYESLSRHLGSNLRQIRDSREMTQAVLAKLCGLPRSTIALLETGEANPTLSILTRLAASLRVSIEELLATPRAQCQLYRKGTLPIAVRDEDGLVKVSRLLPEVVSGTEIDRFEIGSGGEETGTVHRPGTREYFACEKGKIQVWVAGERFELSGGDVLAFSGDQAHSYHNAGTTPAVGFSVVIFSPLGLREDHSGQI